MRSLAKWPAAIASVFAALWLLHYPLLRLPYFWDEAGYYIPAALDFSRDWLLTPKSTLPEGHTPLVMIYLGLAWRVLGFLPMVTRSAMVLVAATTVVTQYVIGRWVIEPRNSREVSAWSALLLALSPLFFAQSSLAHLDLAAGLFTMLAVLALLRERMPTFVLTASLAVLSKETAVVLLPVAWLFMLHRAWARQSAALRNWVWSLTPLLPLLAWALYYHLATGYWIGNGEYLKYNLYSTLNPFRFVWTLPRRLYEVFVGGFNWLLGAGAICGYWFQRKRSAINGMKQPEAATGGAEARPYEVGAVALGDFFFLAGTLGAAYILMLSLVGGAVLPRYLLPIFPPLTLVGVVWVWRLPKLVARTLCLGLAACFVAGWFINPPWPFPYEDNLSYADFIKLHQQAASFLEIEQPHARVLTAWPASDEISRPFLGYVQKPLQPILLGGFASEDFSSVQSESFDILYLYSLKWRPGGNWLTRSARFQKFQHRHLDVAPPIAEESLVSRYHLRLLRKFERRGQWVRIYSRAGP